MLKEIWRSQPVPYAIQGSEDDHSGRPGTIWDHDYAVNKKPYMENMTNPSGVFMVPSGWPHNESAPNAAANLLVLASISTAWWPSWGFGYYRFDPVSGKYLTRMGVFANVGAQTIFTTSSWRSRGGKLYFGHIHSLEIVEVSLGKSATELLPTEPDAVKDSITVIGGVPASHFENMSFINGPLAIDDVPSPDPYDKTGQKTRTYFLMGGGGTLNIWNWATGKWYYNIGLPAGISDIALEDAGRAYILLNTRVIFLFDYIRNEVMGMSRLPPAPEGGSNARITWDSMYRRLLVIWKTPNEPTGKSTTCVRGYRMLPQPLRLTKPIPLIKPRQRRIVPFMVQALGDLNEGIGGYTITATVTGAGSLVGIPLTDHVGNAIINVACDGSFFYGSPDLDPDHDVTAEVPTFQPCLHVMALMWTDSPEVAGGDPWVFCTLNSTSDDLETRLLEAQATHKPLMGYVDGWPAEATRWLLLEEAETRCLEEGVRFLPALMFYPNEGEAVTAYINRIRPAAEEMATRWPTDWGGWFASYRQVDGDGNFHLEIQQVLDCWVAFYDLALELEARWIVGFTWRRPWQLDREVQDGVLMFEEFQTAAAEMKAAVITRTYWPQQGVADPVFPTSAPSGGSGGGSSTSAVPAGQIKIDAKIKVYQPDLVDLPALGYSPLVTPPPTQPGQPGPPEEGPGTDFGPSEVPNLFYIVERVYNSKTWRMTEPYEDEPDGRGAFTEEVVTALHDVDARFGHFDKRAGGNNYHNHAVDACCFKNDDGVSQEGVDLVSGDSGAIQWSLTAEGRIARIPDGEKNAWIYPSPG